MAPVALGDLSLVPGTELDELCILRNRQKIAPGMKGIQILILSSYRPFLLPLPEKGLSRQDQRPPLPPWEDRQEEVLGKVPDGALDEDAPLGLCEGDAVDLWERKRG